MRIARNVSQAVEIGSDPVSGALEVGVQRAFGSMLRHRVLNKSTIPGSTGPMPIDVDDAVRRAPMVERTAELWRNAQTAFIDENYPIRKLSQRTSGETTGALENRVWTLAGFDSKVKSALDRGFFDPTDVTKPIERDAVSFLPGEQARKGLKTIIEDVQKKVILFTPPQTSCISVDETAIEKWVGLTRRVIAIERNYRRKLKA